jgi:hypothetical protein
MFFSVALAFLITPVGWLVMLVYFAQRRPKTRR